MRAFVISSLLLFIPLFSLFQTPTFAEKKSYVVYLGTNQQNLGTTNEIDLDQAINSHYEVLGSCLGSIQEAKDSIFYSYNRFINGFAAVLDDKDVAKLAKNPNVVSIFLNKGRKLDTTHSWDFMGLKEDFNTPNLTSTWKKARFGEDTIIGSLDTGVWPESKSFDDKGMGPVPSKWRGICETNRKDKVKCNRKLIGARYFNKGYRQYAREAARMRNQTFIVPPTLMTAWDTDGHGSHTLSTAGGNFVANASVFGNGKGTAKGGSPKARVAAYKVCWEPIDGQECFDADILAGFEAAINDGVDVISISVSGAPSEFFQDSIAIGSLHATMNGILVVASAGNEGPTAGSVSNVAPWIFTIGASTINRDFSSYVTLGNRKVFKGASLSPKPRGMFSKKSHPLVSAAHAKARNATAEDAILCKPGTLDPKKVKGTILVCLRGEIGRLEKGLYASKAGAVGMILANDKIDGNNVIADLHFLPTSHISFVDGEAVFAYINSNKYNTKPIAHIGDVRTEFNTKSALVMAAFSSRGPNLVDPAILKPDVTAPGVNIIAAFTEATSVTGLEGDNRRSSYNILSGTSMSCPHVSGIVGLLKTLYPSWSPSAIRSAIMTTSRTTDGNSHPMLDSTNLKATAFAYGSGHVMPNSAVDPGLVYDLSVEDYMNYLCYRGYNQTIIRFLTGKPYFCPKNFKIADFNYPSITVAELSGKVIITRRVKNVGSPGTYTVHVKPPGGASVVIKPSSLKFTKIGEEQTFKILLSPKGKVKLNGYFFGQLTWSDGHHHVKSPITVSYKL